MQIKLLYCYPIVCSEDELHGRRLDAVQLYDHRERKTARSGGSTGRRRWLQPTGIQLVGDNGRPTIAQIYDV